jgi:hypothetical protein
MKSLKMIKSTDKFKLIMDRYNKSEDKIAEQKKFKSSLNSRFVNDLNEIRRFRNFSDEQYVLNEIKNENDIKNEKKLNEYDKQKSKEKAINISNKFIRSEKINKDIFFYFRDKIYEKKNANRKINGKDYFDSYMRSKLPYYRIASSKRSDEQSMSSNQSKKSSIRNSNDKLLILPAICSRRSLKRSNQNKSNSYISIDENTSQIINILPSDKNIKTEASEEINSIEGNKDKNKFRKFNKINPQKNENNFNTLNVKKILRNYRNSRENLLIKLQLPLLQNDIFNKINKVTTNSKNISKSINHLSTEGNLAYENEKKRVKFIKEILNE